MCIAEPCEAWGGRPINVRDGRGRELGVNCIAGEGGFQHNTAGSNGPFVIVDHMINFQ